jgi:hypothetical protein
MYDSPSAGVWAAERGDRVKASRLVWFVSVSLLAGALANALVAQAIGCLNGSSLTAPAAERYVPVGGRCAVVLDVRGAGWRFLSWTVQDVQAAATGQYMHANGLTRFGYSGDNAPVLHPDAPDTLPAWAHFWDSANWVPDTPASGGRYINTTCEFAVGWPVLSFSKDADDRAPNKYRGGTVFNTMYSPAVRGFTWRPIFPGVVLGTLLWALPCAILMIAARHVVRARRRRRWQCPTCRYDLRGLPEAAVCPECGGATRAVAPVGPADLR